MSGVLTFGALFSVFAVGVLVGAAVGALAVVLVINNGSGDPPT